LKPAEYLAISDIMEITQHIKDVFNKLKAKIESGEVKGNIMDFLNKLKEIVEICKNLQGYFRLIEMAA